MSAFRVQARLVRHERQRVVRDDVRLVEADCHRDALRAAHDLLGDGFTVWIWTDEACRGGRPPRTVLVERLVPPPPGRGGPQTRQRRPDR